MFVSDKERKIFKICMIASMIIMSIGIFMNNDIIIMMFGRNAFCATNMLFVASIFAPLMLALGFVIQGGNFTVSKILRLKILFGISAFVCLSGILWVLHFGSDGSFYDLADIEKITSYQNGQGGAKFFIGNRLFWGTYGLDGVNLSVVLFVLMVANSFLISSHRLVSACTLLATFLFRIIASAVILFTNFEKDLLIQWLSFNMLQVVGEAIFLLGIIYAAVKDSRWIEFVWGDRYVGTDFEDSEDEE